MPAHFVSLFNARRRSPSIAKTKAATAVEMAAIAPVFFLFLIGTVETSLMLFTQHMLENAAYNTSRLAATGYTTTGQTQTQTVNALLTSELQSMGTLIDTSKVTMTSTAYNSLSSVGVAGQGTTGMGTSGQIVVYNISYPWKLFTPMMSAIIGTGGVVTLSTSIVVQNEPY